MVKSNKRIEIVRSNADGLSSMSRVSCQSAQAVLAKHFARVDITNVNNLADLKALIARRPDLVFLGMEFIPTNPALGLADSNRIWLSDMLDDYGIAYTGSPQTAHELGRNKPLAKQRVLDEGLSTSPFCVIEQHKLLSPKDITLDFPLFIKPTNRGGGLGINSNSVVHNFVQARAKVHSITTWLKSDALIEQYLPGREFSVAILKDEYSARHLAMPLELIAPPDENGSRLLSGEVKSSNTEQVLKVTDMAVKAKVEDLALAVFSALGARDYGRVDIRLDAAGTPHFLEVNLIPSLISGYGSFPKACVLNIGLKYEQMILRIAELGLARATDDIMDIPVPIFAASEIAFEPV
jgi:D-alanine-D-alanine ligase